MFTNSEMTEEEILREEVLLAEYAALTEDTCRCCGSKMGGLHCIRCGAVKEPEQRPIAPFSWADLLGADRLPPSMDGPATILVEKVDTKAVNEESKAPEPQRKQQDTRPDMEPVKTRAPKSNKSAQGGFWT